MEPVHDPVLLQRIGAGDQKSFKHLYDTYWHRLYVAANKVLQDDLVAEDVVQEIFTSLWRKAAGLQVENLNAYLYQAVKFQVAKKLRERSNLEGYLRTMNRVIEEKHPQIEDKLHYADLLQRVNVLIGQLPEKCRDVFVMSRYQHLSNAEIAEEQQISVKTVENQINKALRYLRANLGDYSLLLVLSAYTSLSNTTPPAC